MIPHGRQSDFRWYAGTMQGGIAATVGCFAMMLGVMARLFHWL